MDAAPLHCAPRSPNPPGTPEPPAALPTAPPPLPAYPVAPSDFAGNGGDALLAASVPHWIPAPATTSRQAIAALTCAAVGLLLGFWVLPLVASLAGVVLGHLALAAISRSGGMLRGRGLAIAALVCGYGAVMLWGGYFWLVNL